jgi:hypothetical protein
MIDRRRFVSTAASPALGAIAGACGPALKALAAAEAPIDLGPTLEQIRQRFGLPAVGVIAVSTDRVIARGVAVSDAWASPAGSRRRHTGSLAP